MTQHLYPLEDLCQLVAQAEVRTYNRAVLEAMKTALHTDRSNDLLTVARLAVIVERLIDLMLDAADAEAAKQDRFSRQLLADAE